MYRCLLSWKLVAFLLIGQRCGESGCLGGPSVRFSAFPDLELARKPMKTTKQDIQLLTLNSTTHYTETSWWNKPSRCLTPSKSLPPLVWFYGRDRTLPSAPISSTVSSTMSSLKRKRSLRNMARIQYLRPTRRRNTQ